MELGDLSGPALWEAVPAVRRRMAQAKNPRTVLSGHSATGVAYHVTETAVLAYLTALERKGWRFTPPDR